MSDRDLVEKHADRIETKDQVPLSMLSFLCVAERLFTLDEMVNAPSVRGKKGVLLQVALSARSSKSISRCSSSSVVAYYLRFCHHLACKYMVEQCGSLLPARDERHSRG
jgi:hypothetical protein